MLIAPFPVSTPAGQGPALRSLTRARRAKPPVGALIAWLAIGVGLLLLVPMARGDRLLGATLPFWLVAAPLVDLVWLERRRLAGRARTLVVALRSRRPVRNVRGQRAATCSAARS
jgi:hypothetical protein